MTHHLVFSRIESWELDALMVVEITTHIEDPKDVLKALINGVTSWVRNNTKGRQCWVSSCEDLNIGDLSGYENDPLLQRQLRIAGIEKLQFVTSLSEVNHVRYDMVLVNTEKLEKSE